MLTEPADEMSDAVMSAVHLVDEEHVVVRFEPFHCTLVIPSTKPEPLAVSVNPLPPAFAEVGLTLESVGLGLLFVAMFSARVFVPPAL